VRWAIVTTRCAAVLVGSGALVVRSPQALAIACSAVISVICPRWLLLAGAIVASRAFAGDTVIGQFQASDILLGVFLLRWLGRVISVGVGTGVRARADDLARVVPRLGMGQPYPRGRVANRLGAWPYYVVCGSVPRGVD